MGIGGRLTTGDKWAISLCTGALVIITIGLLAGSWSTVSPTQYGIKYNAVSTVVDDTTIYNSGRVYTGVGGSFFIFPRSLTYVEFSKERGNALDVWSSDGQQIFVEASFYYGLQKDKLFQLFQTYGTNVLPIVVGVAAEAIRDVATQYETLDFFTNRSSIDQAMTNQVTTALASNCFADLQLFNLLAIDVPDAFDAAVQDTVLAAQDVTTQTATRQSTLIRSQVAVIDAQADANVTALMANAKAQATVTVKAAEASTYAQLMQARGEALSKLSNDLGFTTPKQLLTYLFADLVRGNSRTAPTLAVNIDAATIATN